MFVSFSFAFLTLLYHIFFVFSTPKSEKEKSSHFVCPKQQIVHIAKENMVKSCLAFDKIMW